jgi:hypothetical protein
LPAALGTLGAYIESLIMLLWKTKEKIRRRFRLIMRGITNETKVLEETLIHRFDLGHACEPSSGDTGYGGGCVAFLYDQYRGIYSVSDFWLS